MKTLVCCLLLLSCVSVVAEPMTDARASLIANAIFKIEGGTKTKHPYGVLSVKTSNPRKVCINTIKNNYIRWIKAGGHGDYLDFLANVYCPKSADPRGNKNWHHNIHAYVTR